MKKYRFMHRSRLGRALVWVVILQVALLQTVPVWALPNGEQVTHGDVTFTRAGDRLTVDQATSQAIVNYNSFNIGVPETVQFLQPGASASILNRVTGAGSSEIAGALLANGNVYLINPNGILFSASARVDVGGLVASGLPMADADFLAGRLFFSGAGGSVVNEGALSGRYIYLIGADVENRGSISAADVVLAAGQKSVLIDEAAGGQIRLVLDGEEEIVDSGDALADALQDAGDAGPELTVVEAADPAAGVTVVEVLQSRATNAGSIDTTGGGSVHIQASVVDQLGTITAEQDVVLEGHLTLGGSVESLSGGVSLIGHSPLTVATDVSAAGNITLTASETAVAGDDLTINAGVTVRSTGGTVTMNAGDNVVLQAGSTVDANTDLISTAGFGDLDSLGGQTIEGALAAGGSISLTAVEDINIIAPQNSGGASFSAQGANFSNTGGAIDTVGGDVTLDFAGDITVDDAISAGAGDAILTAGGAISGAGLISADGAALRAATGIGDAAALNVAVNTLAADNTSSEAIRIDNGNGGAALTIGTVDGLAGVTGGGSITILTTDDLVLTDVVTATGDGILTATAGAISGAGLVTADGAALRAATGIGDAGALNLAVNTLAADNASSGAIRIDNTNGGAALTIGTVDGLAGVTGADAVTLVTADDLLLTDAVTATGDAILTATAGGISGAGLVTADGAALRAATGIGDAAALNLAVNTLAAENATSGAIRAGDSDALTVGTVDGLAGVTTLSQDGNIILTSVDTLNLLEAVAADGSGNILLQASGVLGDITVNAGVTSGSGNISLLALNDIRQNADVITGGGDISFEAGNAFVNAPGLADGIEMMAGTTTASGGGNIRYVTMSQGDIVLGALDAGTGNISIHAGGSIANGNPSTPNLVADQARLEAGGSLGDAAQALEIDVTTLAAVANTNPLLAFPPAAGDGILISDFSGLLVDEVAGAPAEQVQADGTTVSVDDAAPLAGLTTAGNNGNIVLVANGDLGISQAVNADGSGNVLLAATGADLSLDALVATGSGHINVTAGDDVAQNADITTGGGDVFVQAQNFVDDLLPALDGMTMADGTRIATGGGDLVVAVLNGGTMRLSTLDAGSGTVGLSAAGSVLDNNAGSVNIVGADFGFLAGGSVGTAGDALETTVARVKGQANTAVLSVDPPAPGDGIHLDETDMLLVVDLPDPQATLLGANGSTAGFVTVGPVLAELTSGGNDGAVELTTGGDLTVNVPVSAQGTGAVRLTAGGGGNLAVNAPGSLSTGTGEIRLTADQAVTLAGAANTAGGNFTARGDTFDNTGGAIDTGTGATGSGGAIDIAMNNAVVIGANLTSGDTGADGGAITVVSSNLLNAATALTVNGNISSLEGAGGILSIGSGVILNGAANVGAGDVMLDGGGLDLFINIAQIFDTDTGLIALRDIIINQAVSTVNGANLSIEADTDSLVNTDGLGSAFGGVLVTGAGLVDSSGFLLISGTELLDAGGAPASVSLDTGANTVSAAGNLRIEGKADAPAGSNLELAGSVISTGGSITILSAQGVAQDGAVLTGGGTIDVEALGGDVLMAAAASSASSGGDIRYVAAGDVALGELDAGAGSVSVNAGTSILDANGGSVNVTAAEARFSAGNGVGDLAASDMLETVVGVVAAEAGAGGIGLVDLGVGNLTVGAVGPVAVNRVQTDGTVLPEADASGLSGLTTTTGGGIVMQGSGTRLTVAEAISADTTGNVLVNAAGSAVLSNTVSSGSGALAVVGGAGVTQAAGGDLQTGGAGTILVLSGAGDITMSDGAEATTASGDIVYSVTGSGDVTVGRLNAGSGNVGVVALGSIRDGGDTGGADITAAEASFIAGNSIGRPSDALDIEIGTLEANVTTSIFFDAIGPVAVNTLTAQPAAHQVNPDGTLGATVGTTALGDLRTATGDIVLSANDNISIVGGVNALGGGDILLQTLGAGGIDVLATVQSTTGNLSLLAENGVNLFAGGALSTGGGSIDVGAGTAVFMVDGATAASGGGNILIVAGTDAILGGVDAGAGSVQVRAGGDIVDGGNTDPDVTASAASLVAGNAAGGVGLNGLLDTTIGTVAAQAGAGGIFLDNTGAVDINAVAAFNINRVGTDGATTAESSQAVTGLTTTSGGSIVQLARGGNLTATEAVNADGNVLLQTLTSGDVILNNTADTDSGDISVLAADGVTLAAAGDITGRTGSIDVEAANGAVTMADGAVLLATDGNILVAASGDVTLGSLYTGGRGRDVAVISATGSILDGGDTDVDVVARSVSLEAVNGGVGDVATADSLEVNVSTVAAAAGGNGISLWHNRTVTVASLAPVSVDQVQADGTTVAQSSGVLAGLTTAANGSIIQTVDDSLVVNAAVSANGAGNVRLSAGGPADITLNAPVSSGSGHITLVSGRDTIHQAAGDISTGGGDIAVLPDGAIRMADGAIINSGGGDILLASSLGEAVITGVDAGTGEVAVDASGIYDGGDSAVDITASSIQLVSRTDSIGRSTNKLEIATSLLAADAQANGLFLGNTGAVIIGDAGVATVALVNPDGTTAPASSNWSISDLTTRNNGDLVLVSSGTITVEDGTLTPNGLGVNADGSGNILLQTLGAGDVILNAGVQSGSGSISILGADSVRLATAAADVTTGGGSIDLEASAGTIDFQNAGATLSSGGGNINLSAAGDLVLTGIDAGAGTVTATSTAGSILDGGDMVADITASAAALSAANSVGDLATLNGIDTAVDTVAAAAGAGGISLADADGVNVGTVSGSGVNRVQMDGSTSNLASAVGATGLVTTANGHIVATSTGGDLTVDEAVTAGGAGNIRLAALTSGNVVLNAAVGSGTGSIAVAGPSGIQQNAGGDIRTGGAGTILVSTTVGGIAMVDGATSTSGGGAIDYAADGDILVGGIDAGSGGVGIAALNGSILDNGDTDVDVAAGDLVLGGAGTAGSANDRLDLSVDNLSANAGAGIFLENDQALTVTDAYTGSIINNVAMDGTLSALPPAAGASDLITTSGDIVLVADGTITLNDGTVVADGNAVNAGGSGNVLLMTTAGNIVGNAAIRSGSGNISLDAANDVQLAATGDLVTSGSGTLDVRAGNAVSMADGTDATTGAGNIRVQATAGDVTLGGLVTAGDVAVIAGGSILDGGDLAVDIAAANALLQAGATIGTSANQIDHQLTTLAAQAGDGIFVDELAAGGDLTVGAVAFSGVNRVGMTGATATEGSAAGAGLATTNAGPIVASVANGALTVDEAVTAGGAGNVLLMTGGAGAITLNADVSSSTGSIHLNSASDITQDAAISTAGSGTILVDASGILTMTGAATSTTGGGDIRYQAGSGISVGSLNAGSGSVYVDAGLGVSDAGDAATDIIAAEAYITTATGDIGSGLDALDTQVSTLAALATTGDIFINNTGAVAVDSVAPITVNLVGLDGAATPTATGSFSDLTANDIVLVSDGTITVNDGVDGDLVGVDASGAGNVLLMTTSGDIDLDAIVRSGTGNISVVSGGSLTQTATGDIATGGAGTIDLDAGNGAVAMSDGATATTAGGNILVTAGSDATLGGLNAGAGSVHVQALMGSILDGGDADLDVTAATASFEALGGGVGDIASMAYLETAVDTVAASAGAGGIALEDVDTVSVGSVAAVPVNRVQMDGSTMAQVGAGLTGHTTAAGGAIAQTTTGNLNVDASVDAGGAGNILLLAQGGGALVLNQSVQSGSGNITTRSDDGTILQAAGDMTTGGGDIVIQGGDGIFMTDGATIGSGGGNIRLTALGTDARITGIDAGAGEVAVTAGGAIVDAGDSARDIMGSAARLEAGFSVGQSVNPLETTVSTLAANAGANGLFIDNQGAVTIGDVGPVSADQVQMNGATMTVDSGNTLSDLVTQNNGDLVLVSSDGIIVNDGTGLADGRGVNANGTGDVLVQSTGGPVTLNAGVASGTGNLSVLATGAIRQGEAASLTTGGAGTIDVASSGASVTMGGGSSSATAGGNIRYGAADSVALSALNAGAGRISVIAGSGSITDADNDAGVELTASAARLQAGNGIGSSNATIDTAVSTIAATSGAGGVFLEDQDALILGTVAPITVNRVVADGSTAPVTDGVLSGVNSVGETHVSTVDGDLTVADTSSGSKVLLEAGGAARDAIVNATVTATGGNLAIKATDDVILNTGVSAFQDVALWADTDGDAAGRFLQTTGTAEALNGNLFAAGTDIVQTGPGVLRAWDGTVILSATNDINLGSTLNGIQAHDIVASGANIIVDTVVTGRQTVVLSATGGSIYHTAPGSGHLRATTLGLIATDNVGVSAANPLQVATEFLGSFAEGDEFVVEEDDASAGLLLMSGFYPDQGPELAVLIPRPFDSEQAIVDLLEEKIEAEEYLNIVVPGNLTGDLLLAGNNAIMDIGGSVDLNQIKIGQNLRADIGGDFIVDVLKAGSLNLDVARNGRVGQFIVDTFANADFGGSLSGGSMSIGGPLNLNVGGSLDYGSVSLGAPSDNIRVNGSANVGSLNENGTLILNVGGSYSGGSLSVANTLNGTIGRDVTLGSLNAGTLVMNAGGNGRIDSFKVNNNATATFGGNLAGSSTSVGGTTLLNVGGDWDYSSVDFGGNADVTVGGDATVDDLSAAQNLIAMVGNNFMGSSFNVDNDATLDVGGDWMYDTVSVGGVLDALVGGQTKVTDLEAGTLELDTGSAVFDTLTTGDDANLVSAGDVEATMIDIGNDADFTVGGNLDVVELSTGGSFLADIDNAFTFDQLDARSLAVSAGSINMGRVNTGAASFNAGGSINNNGSMINASTLSMTAGGSIGAGSPIQLNVGTIQTVSGGGNVNFVQNKVGDTPTGLLRAGGTLTVSVPGGGLVDNNGADLNISSGGNSEFNAQYLGTVADALEVEIAQNLLLNGAGLSGQDPNNQTRIFANLEGFINGSGRRIVYIGDVPIPGLVLFNGQLLLGDQFLLAEVFRTEAFVVETPEIRSPEGVFGDPYFIHLYMQISEAWNLFLDFILFGEAQVNADPEMPPDAKRTIKIGGTEKPYAR